MTSVVRDTIFIKVGIILAVIKEGINKGFVTLRIINGRLGAILLKPVRGPAEEMLKAKLDSAVERTTIEEALAVLIALPEGPAKFLDGESLITELTLVLCHLRAFGFHDVGIAEDLLVARANVNLVIGGKAVRTTGLVDDDAVHEAVQPQLVERRVAQVGAEAGGEARGRGRGVTRGRGAVEGGPGEAGGRAETDYRDECHGARLVGWLREGE